MQQFLDSIKGLNQKQLQLMLARKHRAETMGVCVTGMGCCLPGADSPRAFWEICETGKIMTSSYPDGPPGFDGHPRWHRAQFADDAAVAQGAFLHDISRFDPGQYNLDENEALYMDPQQRLLLHCTRQALRQTGLDIGALRNKRIGVFIGTSTSEYLYASLHAGLEPGELSPFMGTGTALSGTAARIAMELGGDGPALTVDTACSSGLTAIHLAMQSLRSGECDWAVAGAAHLLLSPLTFIVFKRAGMLSSGGRSAPFDARADGHARGEGAALLLLRREADCIADGTPVWGVLRASALNQNGRRAHIAAASGESQKHTIREALNAANWAAQDVQYVETQGTGARLAGQIEVENLAQAYERDRSDATPLYIGSAKANIGHTETVSGITSVIKVLYAMKHAKIPAQANFETPDPNIPWAKQSIHVPTGTMPWTAEQRLRAGISAFGFTGTNAHLLLESPLAPVNETAQLPSTTERGPQLWPPGNYW